MRTKNLTTWRRQDSIRAMALRSRPSPHYVLTSGDFKAHPQTLKTMSRMENIVLLKLPYLVRTRVFLYNHSRAFPLHRKGSCDGQLVQLVSNKQERKLLEIGNRRSPSNLQRRLLCHGGCQLTSWNWYQIEFCQFQFTLQIVSQVHPLNPLCWIRTSSHRISTSELADFKIFPHESAISMKAFNS
jgi:hypothetical protein